MNWINTRETLPKKSGNYLISVRQTPWTEIEKNGSKHHIDGFDYTTMAHVFVTQDGRILWKFPSVDNACEFELNDTIYDDCPDEKISEGRNLITITAWAEMPKSYEDNGAWVVFNGSEVVSQHEFEDEAEEHAASLNEAYRTTSYRAEYITDYYE